MKKSRLPGFIALNLIAIVLFSHIAIALPPILGVIRSDTTSSLLGWEMLPCGDQNGDGYADFAAFDARPSIFLYHGGNPLPSNWSVRFDHLNANMSNLGDMNGDGFDDLMLQGLSQYKTKLGLYFGGPNIDTLRDAWFGYDSMPAVGLAARGYDVN